MTASHGIEYNADAHFPQEMADCMLYGSTEQYWISATERFQRKRHKSLPAEYVTVFSGQTDAPEARCDLTDRHTDPTTVTLAVHACRGLICIIIA